MKKGKFTGLVMVCILLLWLMMPVKGENTGTIVLNTKQNCQELVYACSNPCGTPDPALARDDVSALIISNIFEGLVRFSPDSNEIQPCLAKDWEVSEDGLEWTFHLRRGIQFHDGTPFNARAVKFSAERQLKNNPNMIYSRFVYGPVKKIEIIDDYRVKFILKYPYAPFLNNLAMPFAAPVVSPSAVKKFGADFWRHPVGTGPYKFDKWENGKVILRRNPSYWGTLPNLKSITFIPVLEEKARINLLQKKQVHIAQDIAPHKAQLLKQKGFKVYNTTGMDISYLGFYVNKPPFSYRAARQAVNLSIDRVKLVKETLNRKGIPAASYLPPPMNDGTYYHLPADIQKARKLLSTVPLKTNKITLITYTGQRPYNPAGGEAVARSLAAQLDKIGLQVTIKSYPWNEYKKALARQEGNAFLYGWISDNGDPDNFLYPSFSTVHIKTGLNISHFSNPELDTLLVSAQHTLDQPLRKELYKRALDILEQEVPWAVLNHSNRITVTDPLLSGYVPHPTGWDNLSRVDFYAASTVSTKG